MRTADSVSPSITGGEVALTFAGYILAYLVMFPAGVLLMARIVRRGFAPADAAGPVEGGRPTSPISALPGAASEEGN
jgi:cytochrome d ubiquinol oxidase subunit I